MGIAAEAERHPQWDHPAELESLKEYTFREATHSSCSGSSFGLTLVEAQKYNHNGFLVGLQILDAEEASRARIDFDELLEQRLCKASTEEERRRCAHTIWRPFHQELVLRLAKNDRVLSIVEDILGPQFVCWSAHLFCKLAGDPTEQPWHQDAGFWPLSQSRAITVWIAFDDADAGNAAVKYIEGSHRLANLPWHKTDAQHHLLSTQIPDVDLLGNVVNSVLKAGQASVHSDLTVHSSEGNSSCRRRAGLALRYVASEARVLGPMINGYYMNSGCVLPRGHRSDPSQHWKVMRRPGGGKTWKEARLAPASGGNCTE